MAKKITNSDEMFAKYGHVCCCNCFIDSKNFPQEPKNFASQQHRQEYGFSSWVVNFCFKALS